MNMEPWWSTLNEIVGMLFEASFFRGATVLAIRGKRDNHVIDQSGVQSGNKLRKTSGTPTPPHRLARRCEVIVIIVASF
jgi:hypothetical protein